ncbi:MAG: UvrD-helicase domain-containing protein [Patescibacteria group bacterium]
MNLLENLNPEQSEAVCHKDGPLLIVAGAGTGKTAVIAQRVAYIIEQGWAKADEILALTFTEKAAGEMADRVEALLPIGYVDLWISTFHSFCETILKQHSLAIGLPAGFKLLNGFEQWALVKKNLDKFDLDYYRPLGNPTKFIQALIKHFSRAKDENISPADYLEYADGIKENLDSMLGGEKKFKVQSSKFKVKNSKFKVNFENFYNANGELDQVIAEQEIMRINEVANAYHVYQQLLLDNNALDFGDLIDYCLKLFKDRPAILEKYKKQFKFILLDEFQDTNWAQYELIKLLVSNKENLVVVGDDDQCLPGQSLVLTNQGEKRIDKIACGELVATAVGKGYLSYSKVDRVMKNKKTVKLVTFTTAKGAKITATDNHKMFCYVPSAQSATKACRRFYYVYLMHKQELGWRLGITNNLAVRLKLERSADRIVALRSFDNEEEARYQETLLSLKYGMPTVCFQEKQGIMTRRIWNEKLYQDLNVDLSATKLACDLGIDLAWHQVCSKAVNHGNKVRIKINLEMCSRNYRSKHAKGIFLTSPKVLHLLTVETSHHLTIKILRRLGFNLIKAKKGQRLRLTSVDLLYLGQIAMQIKQATGGIIENKIKVDTANIQRRKALIIPASNVLAGMYLPVMEGKKIVYQQIIKRQEEIKTINVYDLEVALTHNFVVNRVVVHNSIYKFRGASLSNILQFKKDFPKSKEIILTKNYRSQQNILDLSYDFIKLNNPNRLECQLSQKHAKSETNGSIKSIKSKVESQKPEVDSQKLDKKLVAQNNGLGEIEVITGVDLADEVKLVIEKIIEIKIKDKTCSWNDFVILVRANDSAKIFINELEQALLPYIFGASRGLYLKPIIIDVISYFKLLDNYHESRAVYRILNLPIFSFTYQELVNFNFLATKKAWSLYEVLINSSIWQPTLKLLEKINKVLALIDKHTALVKCKTTSEVFLAFMNDSGYLQFLTNQDDRKSQEATGLLNQFLKRIKAFETTNDDKSVKAFLEELNMEMEAGEEGSLTIDLDVGPEAIKILTAHGAKGLEFKYVFIVNLVDKRFPTIEHHEQIELPDALVKEILPTGDIHLQEERRLFYVAMTRAKKGLYFSWAEDYGGLRKKKPSRFLSELGLASQKSKACSERSEWVKSQKLEVKSQAEEKNNISVPNHFSYTQLTAFSNCPYQYRFAHILKVPTRGKEQFSFGKTLHITLQKFFSLINERRGLKQADLFNNQSSTPPTHTCKGGSSSQQIKLGELLELYQASWIDDWYESSKKKEDRRRQGQEILTIFYEKHKDNWPIALFLEKGFNIKLADNNGLNTVRGIIDRIDQVGDKIKICDYKTGQPKTKLTFDEKEQLFIYQLAVEEIFRQPVDSLSFYYLDNNSEVEFLGSQEDLAKVKAKIISTIAEIKKGEFPPRPSQLCKFCDFKDICEYRQS